MPFKAKELREALKDIPDSSDVYIVLDGSIVPKGDMITAFSHP